MIRPLSLQFRRRLHRNTHLKTPISNASIELNETNTYRPMVVEHIRRRQRRAAAAGRQVGSCSREAVEVVGTGGGEVDEEC